MCCAENLAPRSNAKQTLEVLDSSEWGGSRKEIRGRDVWGIVGIS